MAQSSRVITALAEDVGSYHLQWESPIPKIWCFLLVSLDSRMHMYTWTHQYSHVCMYTHTRWGTLVKVLTHLGLVMACLLLYPHMDTACLSLSSTLISFMRTLPKVLSFIPPLPATTEVRLQCGDLGRHSSQQLCRKPDGSFFFSYKL